MCDATLISICEWKIRGGDLPPSIRATLQCRYSREGTTCGVCGRPIARELAEIELRWQNGEAKLRAASSHPACFIAWAEAVRRLELTLE
jgi:hypothetical protein